MYSFRSISSIELVVLAAVIAISFSDEFTLEELNVLGNFIIAVGSILQLIAAQEVALAVKKDDSKKNVQQQIEELKELILSLQH